MNNHPEFSLLLKHCCEMGRFAEKENYKNWQILYKISVFYSFIYNRRSLASHVLTTNKPVDWRLFSSLVLVAAAAFWVLCCSWYLLHGLDHDTHLKKGHRISNEANHMYL